MRTTATSIILFCGLLLARHQVVAAGQDYWSGNHWYAKCTSNELADKFLCLGFVMGLMEAQKFLEGAYRMIDGKLVKTSSFCVPKGATVGQREDIFVKFMRDHPGQRHERASVIFAVATREAFCKD